MIALAIYALCVLAIVLNVGSELRTQRARDDERRLP